MLHRKKWIKNTECLKNLQIFIPQLTFLQVSHNLRILSFMLIADDSETLFNFPLAPDSHPVYFQILLTLPEASLWSCHPHSQILWGLSVLHRGRYLKAFARCFLSQLSSPAHSNTQHSELPWPTLPTNNAVLPPTATLLWAPATKLAKQPLHSWSLNRQRFWVLGFLCLYYLKFYTIIHCEVNITLCFADEEIKTERITHNHIPGVRTSIWTQDWLTQKPVLLGTIARPHAHRDAHAMVHSLHTLLWSTKRKIN